MNLWLSIIFQNGDYERFPVQRWHLHLLQLGLRRRRWLSRWWRWDQLQGDAGKFDAGGGNGGQWWRWPSNYLIGDFLVNIMIVKVCSNNEFRCRDQHYCVHQVAEIFLHSPLKWEAIITNISVRSHDHQFSEKGVIHILRNHFWGSP